jgi:bifunctional UDP-N-acetylglucosamine pyrophosphorylase/glucosamine-1-phosphate N-acetyltransferase
MPLRIPLHGWPGDEERAVNLVHVILAAGFGTRMKSELPKVMHSLLGRPMVEWAVNASTAVSGRAPVLVVGHGREAVQAHLGARADYVVQQDLLGTGHAVMQAAPHLRDYQGAVVVSYADMPLLQAGTLRRLVDAFAVAQGAGQQPALAMLTVTRDDPQAFGRVVRDAAGAIQAIVEEVDCTPEQRAIKELNPGVYCFDAQWLWANLTHIPRSAKGEYYLTDMVGIAVRQGRTVATLEAPTDEVNGINNRVQLAQAAQVLQRRIVEGHMLNGVTIIDPANTYIEDTVRIGADTTIWPGCLLQGATAIGRHAMIGPYSQIVDSAIGDYCRVSQSVIEEARMDAHSQIGPFGHLRKGAHLGEGVHMGNFGEVKNSYLGPGVKMGHFSYIGDAQVAAEVNIGAGTITCNFDGTRKNQTVIGEGAFIGSDTLLVAPVEIGAGARTGAGSVVTHDVPAGGLVYGVPARPPKPRLPVAVEDTAASQESSA